MKTEVDSNDTRQKLLMQTLLVENQSRAPILKRNQDEIKRLVDHVVRHDLI